MSGGRTRALGCTKCSERQLPCDGTRPICLNCKQAGISCERWLTREQSGQAVHRWIVQIPGPPARRLDDSTFFSHLKNVLFRQAQSDRGGSWVGFEAVNRSLTALSRNSLLALSQSFFGRARQDKESSRAGLRRYVSCLRVVNQRLANRASITHDDTLLAVTILGAYEMLLLTEKTAWAKHYIGTAAILGQLGPRACADPVVFNIFRSSRFMIILAAMATGATTCIEQTCWLDEPWEARGITKTTMDTLQDIMMLLPTMNRDSALEICSKMDEWLRESQNSLEENMHTSERSAAFPECWPDPYIYTNLQTANEYTMAHSTYIAAIVHLMRSGADLEPGYAAELFMKARSSATEIVRSTDYLLSPTHAYLGSLFSFWPLRNAWIVLRNESAESKSWIESRVEQANSGARSWKAGVESFDYSILGD